MEVKDWYSSDGDDGGRWNKQAKLVKRRIRGCVLGNYWGCKGVGLERHQRGYGRSSLFMPFCVSILVVYQLWFSSSCKMHWPTKDISSRSKKKEERILLHLETCLVQLDFLQKKYLFILLGLFVCLFVCLYKELLLRSAYHI